MTDQDKWKANAREQCKSYYLAFGGCQWHAYKAISDRDLLKAKICYAMFGAPEVAKESLEAELIDGYTDDQKTKASAIMDKIYRVFYDTPAKELLVGMIFVCCKMEKDEFPVPLFAVCNNSDPTDPRARSYVDCQGRTYKDWQDWKDNNTMPILDYAYPRYGFYSCASSCEYDFDEDKEPNIEFGSSPQSALSSQILSTTDTVSSVTSLTCGVIGIAAMFTPLAPVVLLSSAVAGGSSAVYGAARAVGRLVDKGTHSESMTDLESWMLYLSIAATPLNFTTSLVNANLARGAQMQGRIFSSSTRLAATILNFSTFGVDSVLVGLGLANLIEKSKNGQLTTMDVVQFSMSLFFFSNTLIRPKTASAIIQQAQDQHIQKYSNSMTDKAAKATFDRFLNENKGDGGIKDTSKIIRTINRIDNPDRVFGGLQNADKLTIGGRKGKTLLVTDKNNRETRINPNKVIFTTEQGRSFRPVTLSNKHFGGQDVERIRVNGQEIFDGLTDQQKARVNRVVSEHAKSNPAVVQLSLDIADSLQCTDHEQFLSVVEIVSADVKQHPNVDQVAEIRNNFNEFVSDIRRDIGIAEKIASERGDVNFRDSLKGVYHYRKHGSDFVSHIQQQTVEVYLNELPNKLVADYNLTECKTNLDGSTTKFYITSNDKFAVVLDMPPSVADNGGPQVSGDRIVQSMYVKHGSYANFVKRLEATQAGVTKFNPLEPLPQFVNNSLGFRGCAIHLILENGETFEMPQK